MDRIRVGSLAAEGRGNWMHDDASDTEAQPGRHVTEPTPVAGGSGPAWAVPPAALLAVLYEHPWREIANGWSRRNNAPLRAHVEHLLRQGDADDRPGEQRLADDPLRLWRRLSQAVFAGEMQPLLHLLPDDLEGAPVVAADRAPDWEVIANLVLRELHRPLDAMEVPGRAVATATLQVFAYLECLVFWEHSMVYDQIDGIVAAMADRHEVFVRLAGTGEFAEGIALQISEAAVDLARSLSHQFEVEHAIGCCSPERLAAAANAVHRHFRGVAAHLHSTWETLRDARDADRLGTPEIRTLEGLVALLVDDIAQTAPYHLLLDAEVAPAAAEFIGHLRDGRDPAGVRERIGRALDACHAFERSAEGSRSVAATETRAHRLSLQAAIPLLEDGVPMLLFEKAEVTYVFPFGLPVAASGDDPVRRVLRRHLRGDADPQVGMIPRIAGVRAVLDDTPQTDAWLEQGDHGGGLDYVGVRLLLEDELVLRTSSGRIYRDLGLEVRLGGLGNHYVRASIGTQTSFSDDNGQTWHHHGEAWTPHTLDQMIRRGNSNVGDEELGFRRRTDPVSGGSEQEAGFVSLIEMAARIVADIVAFARVLTELEQQGGEINAGSTPDPGEDVGSDLSAITDFLGRHAQVLVSVTDASALQGGQLTPVEDADAFLGLAGATVALSVQRPYAQSVLEWLRYPNPTEEERHRQLLPGRVRRELIWSSGDTCTVFAPSLPNWQLMETLELIEFSISLTGVYSRRQNWLRLSLAAADRSTAPLSNTAARTPAVEARGARLLPSGNSLDLLTTEQITAELERVRAVEVGLDECLNHVQVLLDRARSFRVSGDVQSRELVRHICSLNGVVDLQDGLAASIGAADAQQRLVHARVERIQAALDRRLLDEADLRRSQAERPIQLLVSALTVFALIDLFSWSNSAWDLARNRWVWVVEAVGLLLVAGLVVGINLRLWRDKEAPHATDGSTDS